VTIIAIIALLYHLLVPLLALLQKKNLQIGLAFIENRGQRHIRHHRGLVFVVPVSRMDSIGDRQDDLDKPENNEDNCHKMNNILF
jgi:hypothetical protein